MSPSTRRKPNESQKWLCPICKKFTVHYTENTTRQRGLFDSMYLDVACMRIRNCEICKGSNSSHFLSKDKDCWTTYEVPAKNLLKLHNNLKKIEAELEEHKITIKKQEAELKRLCAIEETFKKILPNIQEIINEISKQSSVDNT